MIMSTIEGKRVNIIKEVDIFITVIIPYVNGILKGRKSLLNSFIQKKTACRKNGAENMLLLLIKYKCSSVLASPS